MMAAEHITATKTSFYRTLPGKLCTAWLLLGVLTVGACRNSGPQSEPNEPSEPNVAQAAPPTDNSLFDGKTLGNWKITDFGGQGNVYVKDGSIYLEMGNDMTGITWAAPLPAKTNYEITLEAMRVDGSDFFCGLTFPVGENFCSLVLGGWGGCPTSTTTTPPTTRPPGSSRSRPASGTMSACMYGPTGFRHGSKRKGKNRSWIWTLPTERLTRGPRWTCASRWAWQHGKQAERSATSTCDHLQNNCNF
ncbi:MAG: LamG domain-containing protein [Planctomycetota bacterium]